MQDVAGARRMFQSDSAHAEPLLRIEPCRPHENHARRHARRRYRSAQHAATL